MKPICVKCQRFYRMKQSGFYFVEEMPKPGHAKAKPGTEEPERWQPYKLWAGDLWTCEGCGHEMVSGTGRAPLAEHYQTTFKVQNHIMIGSNGRMSVSQYKHLQPDLVVHFLSDTDSASAIEVSSQNPKNLSSKTLSCTVGELIEWLQERAKTER